MKEDIRLFAEQFNFLPEIKNKEKWGSYKKYILFGMGGSHIQGDVLKSIFPEIYLYFHQGYGLPNENIDDAGLVMASYSGNTEEVLDSLKDALERNLSVLIISKGGKIIEIAKEKNLPYIELPQNNVQPRIAMGYSYLALLCGLGIKEDFSSLKVELTERGSSLEEEGKTLSKLLENRIPIIYSTQRNYATALFWKINFNEAPKIPSFCNFIPELNHNEMTGFDALESNSPLSEKMTIILLRDLDDDQRNQKRMSVLKEVLEKRNISVTEVNITGKTRAAKIFSTVILSAWTAYYLSGYYGVDPSQVPMVEEFKKMI